MSTSRTVTTPAPLLEFLFAHWPDVKKKQVRTWLKHQCVSVNDCPTSQFDQPLQAGDRVAIQTDGFAAPQTVLAGGLQIRHEDAVLLVIEKPANLLSIASEREQEKTAYFQLTAHVRRGNPQAPARIWIVHRLDRETSGLMVFAKNEKAKRTLQTQWDQAEKRYQAVIEGCLPKDRGTFTSDLDESNPFRVRSVPRSPATRRAITHYRVLKKGATLSLVELTLETGRRHQIRVQLADAGCPIVGDEKYRAKTDPVKRLGLHASLLKFLHPETRQPLNFESPLPRELVRLVR